MERVLLTAAGVGGATLRGALIGFLFRDISHKFSDIVLSFAAGVMLSAAVVGLILATGLTMLLSLVVGVTTVEDAPSVDWISLLIFVLLAGSSFLWRRVLRKRPSPILLILLSAVLGMVLTPLLEIL